MGKKLKAGIIGMGSATSISLGHLRGYLASPDVEFVGVYNPTRSKAETWCEANGLSRDIVHPDADSLIEEADIVSVCTPNYTHADYIKRCLRAGTNLLCEKPLAGTSDDWEGIPELIESSSASVMVNFNYRYLPGLRLVREAVASPETGKIYMIRHNMGAPRLANEAVPLEWRFVRKLSGAGALADFGSHALDMLRFVLGEDDLSFTTLSARTSTYIKERTGRSGGPEKVENDDAAMVLATMGDETMYNLTLSRVGTAPSVMEIVAERAIIRFDLSRPCEMIIQRREPGKGYTPPEVVTAPESGEWSHNTLPAPYIACAYGVRDFVSMVESGRKPDTDLYYAYSILRTIEEIEKAARL